jgi:hypothetical protein
VFFSANSIATYYQWKHGGPGTVKQQVKMAQGFETNLLPYQ